MADAGEQDLLAATAGQRRRVRPEFVNYAKRAKRVDVRKLKENIWKGLDIVAAAPERDSEDDMVSSHTPLYRGLLIYHSKDVDEISARPPTNPAEARVFGQVIDGLQKSYPRDKMAEISTSFCFICLLHLANEQGLKLESGSSEVELGAENDENDKIGKRVGDIWGLKVIFSSIILMHADALWIDLSRSNRHSCSISN